MVEDDGLTLFQFGDICLQNRNICRYGCDIGLQFRSHGGYLPGQLGVYRGYLSRQVLSQLLDSREYLV
ncbi:hypothetical protein WCLP8_2350002 [uncultured Gammaproteobacteria bacterium]